MNDLRGTSHAEPKNFGARYLERRIFEKSRCLNISVLYVQSSPVLLVLSETSYIAPNYLPNVFLYGFFFGGGGGGECGSAHVISYKLRVLVDQIG